MINRARSLDVETRPFIDEKLVLPLGRAVIEKISPVDGRPIPSIRSCKAEDEIYVSALQ